MQQSQEQRYMAEALTLARQAQAAGEIPVGCVVVKDGAVIGRGRNRTEADRDATAHAEMEAIRQACRTLGGWRLEDCTLYVTLEPCPMCAGAIRNARISTVVYGAKNPVSGCLGGVIALYQERFGYHPAVYGGVLAQEAADLLGARFDR